MAANPLMVVGMAMKDFLHAVWHFGFRFTEANAVSQFRVAHKQAFYTFPPFYQKCIAWLQWFVKNTTGIFFRTELKTPKKSDVNTKSKIVLKI